MNKVPAQGEELTPLNPETVSLNVWLNSDKQFKKAFDVIKTFNVAQKEVGAAAWATAR